MLPYGAFGSIRPSVLSNRGSPTATPDKSRAPTPDRHRADGLCIKLLRRPDAADDSVAKALVLHGFEAGDQQGFPIPFFFFFCAVRLDAGGAEEVGGKVASWQAKPTMAFLLDRDEAGDRLAAERDLGFAGPHASLKFFRTQAVTLCFSGGKRTPQDDSGLVQPVVGGPGIRQVARA